MAEGLGAILLLSEPQFFICKMQVTLIVYRHRCMGPMQGSDETGHEKSQHRVQHAVGIQYRLAIAVTILSLSVVRFPCCECRTVCGRTTIYSLTRASRGTLGTENEQGLGEPPCTCPSHQKSRAGLWELHYSFTLWGDSLQIVSSPSVCTIIPNNSTFKISFVFQWPQNF